jgi:hypothetical protein
MTWWKESEDKRDGCIAHLFCFGDLLGQTRINLLTRKWMFNNRHCLAGKIAVMDLNI